jgi:superfamily I DNA/RNA helicase
LSDRPPQLNRESDSPDRERRRALAIFRYLRDLTLLRNVPVRDLRSYERCFWLDSLRDRVGCSARCFRPEASESWLEADTDEDDDWFTVKKLPEPLLPPIPARVRAWVANDSGKHVDSPPRLLSRIPRPQSSGAASRGSDAHNADANAQSSVVGSPPAYESLEAHPEIVGAFNSYIQAHWKPWAKQHAAWTDFQEKVYAPLFAIHRELKRLGEEFELVLGLGCLTWSTPSGQQVRRHLITAQVALEFDPAGGMFTVRPASDGARLALEVDMLDPSEQPSVPQREVIAADLAQTSDDPWDFKAIDRALRGFTQAIKEDGAYDPFAYEPIALERVPRTAFAPALLLRRRTSKGLLPAIEQVIAQIQMGETIPSGVRRLTEAAKSQDVGDQLRGNAVCHDLPTSGRIYFPLEANEDQRQIIERLEGRNGVLVQGPPGTGKSHTIANLICHLLATGQRVLITAQTPRALQVLREKLPAEIRPLCLSVLGNDKAAHDGVEDSVRNITDLAESWKAESASEDIRKVETELDSLTKREAALERELRTFRELELRTHAIGDGTYSGTAQAISKRVRCDSARFNWFVDTADPDSLVPLDEGSLLAYRNGIASVSPQRVTELKQRRPMLGSDIPSDDTLTRLIRSLRTLMDRVRASASSQVHLRKPSLDRLHAASTALRTLQATVHQAPSTAAPWAAAALSDVLKGTIASWELLLSRTMGAVAANHSVATTLDARDIRLPTGKRSDLLLADVTDLLSHLQSGGTLGFWLFRPKVVKRTLYLCQEATIDGRPCDHAATLQIAKEYLNCSAAIEKAWALWGGKSAPSTKTITQQIEELRELAIVLAKILAVRPQADAASIALAQLRVLELPPLHDPHAVSDFLAHCDNEIVRRDCEAVASQLDAWVRVVRNLADLPDAHPVCLRLAKALEVRNEDDVHAAMVELASLNAEAARLAEWERLEKQVLAKLPRLARSIAATHTDPAWNDRLAEWRKAWRWAQANSWLDNYSDPRNALAAEAELRQVKKRVTACLVRVSAARAWYSCLSAMTPAHQQHLNAWRQAIKKIGKGTGKHAGHWRRVSQGELEKCRDAIPAWVMPLYRVFETVTPAPGIFDVVIVDEASQCGPESLLLFYLAKRIVVVGDDKQISPSNIGIDKDQAKSLLTQHLDGIELAETFDVDSSLFDHGQVRLGKRITLQEHFRCMPEIIRFSNDLCYKGALIPLRQYPLKRLAPFVACRVPDGKREGGASSAKNRAEAEAIVEAIAACCVDPMYKDKTMGVISLLGEHQAKLIERLLLKRIGAEEIERRKIVCGDAYSFQGDERDVIFLSLVVSLKDDDSRGFSALTKLSDMQRFNVSASRARDQLWLFHSVMPDDIGNPECMRHQLLTYFYDPARHAAQSIGVELDDLRRQASSSDRPELVPAPFESWFEVDVYLRIADRGYRVLPQFKAGRKRIDLVVEGRTRLAVECDGDRFHTDENFDEDMARQRQLERAHWQFWRVRGSAFYRDPDAALVSLWDRLKELGIEPMPAIDGSGSGYGHIPDIPAREPIETTFHTQTGTN